MRATKRIKDNRDQLSHCFDNILFWRKWKRYLKIIIKNNLFLNTENFVAPYAFLKTSVDKGKFYAFGLPVVIKLHKKSAFVHADLVPWFFRAEIIGCKIGYQIQERVNELFFSGFVGYPVRSGFYYANSA